MIDMTFIAAVVAGMVQARQMQPGFSDFNSEKLL